MGRGQPARSDASRLGLDASFSWSDISGLLAPLASSPLRTWLSEELSVRRLCLHFEELHNQGFRMSSFG